MQNIIASTVSTCIDLLIKILAQNVIQTTDETTKVQQPMSVPIADPMAFKTRMETMMTLLDVQVRLQSIGLDKKQTKDTSQLTQAQSASLAAPIQADMLGQLEMGTATLSEEICKLVAMNKSLSAFENATVVHSNGQA